MAVVEFRLTVYCALLRTKVAYPDVEKFFSPESDICNPDSGIKYCARLAREGNDPAEAYEIDSVRPSSSPDDSDCRMCKHCFTEPSEA